MSARRRKAVCYDPAVFFTKVSGVSYENTDGTSRQRLVRRLRAGQPLYALRDTQNEHDRNAISICAKFGILKRLRQIGFLSAELAGGYAPLLDAGGRIDAEVSEVTGGRGWLWWKTHHGVNIRVTVYAFKAEV